MIKMEIQVKMMKSQFSHDIVHHDIVFHKKTIVVTITSAEINFPDSVQIQRNLYPFFGRK